MALTPKQGSSALQVADGSGAPVASVGSLALRALDTTQLKSTPKAKEGLLTIEWAKATLPEGAKAPTDTEPLHCKADPKLPSPEAARKATEEALAAIQQWLADQSKADLRLALITEGAMATSKEESPDPATAAIWGLIRSAQSEHPGRFALIDSDGSEASEQALPQALTLCAEEPQLALRQGEALVPRALPAKDTEDSLIPPAGPLASRRPKARHPGEPRPHPEPPRAPGPNRGADPDGGGGAELPRRIGRPGHLPGGNVDRRRGSRGGRGGRR